MRRMTMVLSAFLLAGCPATKPAGAPAPPTVELHGTSRVRTPPGADVTDASFEAEVLRSPEPVVVTFWAPWAGPAHAVAPVLHELASEYAGRVRFASLNVDDNPTIPARFEVRSVPVMIVFAGGREVERVVGAVPKARIAAAIDRALGE